MGLTRFRFMLDHCSKLGFVSSHVEGVFDSLNKRKLDCPDIRHVISTRTKSHSILEVDRFLIWSCGNLDKCYETRRRVLLDTAASRIPFNMIEWAGLAPNDVHFQIRVWVQIIIVSLDECVAVTISCIEHLYRSDLIRACAIRWVHRSRHRFK